MDHIIQRQVIEINLDQEPKNGYQFQSDIIDLIESEVMPKLGEWLDEVAPANEYVMIDKLELDLGVISPRMLNSELSDKIFENFKQQIKGIIENSKTSNQSKSNIGKPKNQTLSDALIFFLDTGTLPWWSPETTVKKLTTYFVQETREFEWLVAQPGLYTLLKDDKKRQRFSSQLPTELIWQIIFPHPGFRPQIEIAQIKKSVFESLETAFDEINRWSPENLERIFFSAIVELTFTDSEELFWQTIINSVSRKINKPKKTIVSVLLNRFTVKQAENKSFSILDTLQKSLEKIEKQLGPAKSQGRKEQLMSGKIVNEDASLETSTKSGENEKGGVDKKELQKRGRKKIWIPEEGLFIENAGLVLLWPYFGFFFKELELTKDDAFVSELTQQKAVCLMHWVATKVLEPTEEQLIVPKLLCNWPIDEPLITDWQFSEKEIRETETLLKAVIKNWGALGNVSPDGLREGFIQRNGMLKPKDDDHWLLQIEQKTIDVLLGKLPWGLGVVRLPWQDYIIHVEWG
ncbi:MAG: contractile injection system tape measure protein [Bacteroidota bacterium]